MQILHAWTGVLCGTYCFFIFLFFLEKEFLLTKIKKRKVNYSTNIFHFINLTFFGHFDLAVNLLLNFDKYKKFFKDECKKSIENI